MKEIKLGKKIISDNHPPFIIAEMSGNHNQSLERAIELVHKAADSGVDALKIQTYTADTMTLDLDTNEFFIKDPKSLWKGKSLYQLYHEAHTPWEWHYDIKKACEERGLEFFSTPFDNTAVDFLEKLGVSFYKIASFELTDLPLIKKVAQTKKPLIMSTGMGTIAEVQAAVDTARANGCKDIILLKCTSAYPAEITDANLLTIKDMKERFNVEVGLSDHTLGLVVPITSVVMGANIIEKHFTLNRQDGGVDSAFSLEPHEFKQLCVETKNARLAMGKINYGTVASDAKNVVYRRSIYVSNSIKKGEKITENNIKIIRPGFGLAPVEWESVLGKTASCDLAKGTPLKHDHLI